MVLDEKPHHVGGLCCYGNIIQCVLGRETDEQVGGNHHGNIVQVHLVGRGIENNFLKKFKQSLKKEGIHEL